MDGSLAANLRRKARARSGTPEWRPARIRTSSRFSSMNRIPPSAVHSSRAEAKSSRRCRRRARPYKTHARRREWEFVVLIAGLDGSSSGRWINQTEFIWAPSRERKASQHAILYPLCICLHAQIAEAESSTTYPSDQTDYQSSR